MKQYDLQNLYCKNNIFGLYFRMKIIMSVVTGQNVLTQKNEVATDTIRQFMQKARNTT